MLRLKTLKYIAKEIERFLLSLKELMVKLRKFGKCVQFRSQKKKSHQRA